MDFIFEYKEFIAILIGFLIVTLAAERIAAFFQKFNLPLITGLIIAGIVAGPFILHLIPAETTGSLRFIYDTSLAFIAFAAGSELYLKDLRSRLHSIQVNAFVQTGITVGIFLIAFFVARPHIPFIAKTSFTQVLIAALFTGLIFSTRSMASAMAVISETKAKGPFTQSLIGISVLKESLVTISFSVLLAVSKTLLTGGDLGLMSLVAVLIDLALAIAFGIGLAKILELVHKFIGYQSLRYGVILLIGFLVYQFAPFLEHSSESSFGFKISVEPLIMCIACGFYLANYTKYRSDFLKFIKDSAGYVFIIFFFYVGIGVRLDVLSNVWLIAVIFFGVRLLSLAVGAFVSGIMTKDPKPFYQIGWMAYITQASFGIGLSTILMNEFPDWGQQLGTIIIAGVVYSQLIGPILFKKVLSLLKEQHVKAKHEPDGHDKDALIIGFEGMSVALARQLIDKGWNVSIATFKQSGSFQEPEGIKIHHLKSLDRDALAELGGDEAEAIVSMLSDEENLKVCEIAYEDFGTEDLIVRMTDRQYHEQYQSFGARAVDPNTAMVNLLEHFVRSPQATSLLLGLEGDQDTRDIRLRNPNLHGIALRDLRLPADVIILSVKRGGHTIISHGYTRLRRGDIITMVGTIKSLNDTANKFEG